MTEETAKVLELEYESKADNFILPLTGVVKNLYHSYMFWRDHSIEDYKLTIEFEYGPGTKWNTYEDFLKILKRDILPILDKNAPILESYDLAGRTILIVDLSDWAFDIDLVLAGKYSKMSQTAKEVIKLYHEYQPGKIDVRYYCTLFPKHVITALDHMSGLEWIADKYDLPYEELLKVGEIGRIYDKEKETLVTDVQELC